MELSGTQKVLIVLFVLCLGAFLFINLYGTPQDTRPRCNDTTLYDECSNDTLLFCQNGTLVNKSSICGCASGFRSENNVCVSILLDNPKTSKFEYYLDGKERNMSLVLYEGLYDYVKNLERDLYCPTSDPCTLPESDFVYHRLNDTKQNKFLDDIVYLIQNITNEKDDQARIVISMIQNIPYDEVGVETGTLNNRYGYEVLYEDLGVCGEKSELITYLLKGLGYGSVMFSYGPENHMALGIKCPLEYSYKDTGFCFVESTVPTIITDYEGKFPTFGYLSSDPTLIPISDGLSMTSVKEEYDDAREFRVLTKKTAANNGELEQDEYDRWVEIVTKYNIPTVEAD